MGAAESKFFQFLLTEEERPDDDGRRCRVRLPGEREILRKLSSSESDVSAQLQKSFNPNQQMHASSFKDTSLTYAVRYEHKLFVNECLQRGGDPVVTNARGETAFHIACSSTRSSQRTDKKRKEILQQLLEQPVKEEHNSPSTHNGVSHDMKEGLDMERSCNYHPSVWLLDMDKNTPLHLAAQSGLLGCVELLLAYGAPVLVKNASGKTPCDLASDNDHVVIVKLLESKMYLEGRSEVSEEEPHSMMSPKSQSYSIKVSPEELICLKQDLIKRLKRELQVTQMIRRALILPDPLSHVDLRIRSFAAELLLAHYEWSLETVVKEWETNPLKMLSDAGITLHHTIFAPRTTSSNSIDLGSLEVPLPTLTLQKTDKGGGRGRFECLVHCGTCYEDERAHGLRCQEHKCCTECFMEYIGSNVTRGNVQNIPCPGHNCKIRIPSSTVERYMPSDVKEKYQRFGLAAFVDAHDKIKWCPRKECEKVVTYPPPGGVVTVNTAVNVECEDGHTFCWACLEEPGHEPLPCEMWKRWLETIENSKYHKGKFPLSEAALVEANTTRWIATNTKPCPKCKVDIEKNSGCNHMKCFKCKHSFCWVCLKPWSNHYDFYQCTNLTEILLAKQRIDARQEQANETAKAMEEEASVQKFKVLYTRYQNHLDSLRLECVMMNNLEAKLVEMSKMGAVLEYRVNKVAKVSGVDVSQPQNNIEVKDKFLYNTYGVLIRSRPILAASYALSYFLPSDEKIVLEHQESQGRLEGAVEELAGLVARHHLKTTMSEMLHVARSLVKQCEEYVCKFRPIAETCLARLTNPPEEPEDPVEEDREDRLLTLLLGNPRAMYDIFMFRILEEMEQSLIVGRHDDDSDDDDDDDDENED
jgi:hypothetical protein